MEGSKNSFHVVSFGVLFFFFFFFLLFSFTVRLKCSPDGTVLQGISSDN